jgi:hypothetical protein
LISIHFSTSDALLSRFSMKVPRTEYSIPCPNKELSFLIIHSVSAAIVNANIYTYIVCILFAFRRPSGDVTLSRLSLILHPDDGRKEEFSVLRESGH